MTVVIDPGPDVDQIVSVAEKEDLKIVTIVNTHGHGDHIGDTVPMAKRTGWAPRGQRLVDHAPFGHWRTQSGASPVQR